MTMPMHSVSDDGAEEEQRVGADPFGDERGNARARQPAERRAAADEPEEPLGLSRIVDGVGQRPELADQQNGEDQTEDVERDRHPLLTGLKQGTRTPTGDDDRPLGMTGMTQRAGIQRRRL